MTTNEITSEAAARKALEADGSPAADESKYSARAIPGAWIFNVLRDADGGFPIGSCPWIVTTSGDIAMVPINKSPRDVLAELQTNE